MAIFQSGNADATSRPFRIGKPTLMNRTQLARYATAANGLAVAVQAAVSLLGVRWTLHYLGDERFGLWMTVLGIAGFLSFADAGVGNALVTRVAAARAGIAGVAPSVAVTGGIAVLTTIAACVSGVGSIIAALFPWERVLDISNSTQIRQEFRTSAVVFVALFGVSFLTTGVRRIYEGLQRGYVSHLATCISSCLSLACLYAAARNRLGITPLLLATFGVTTLVPLMLLLPPLWARRYFQPLRLLADARHELRCLLHVGSQYSVVQIGSLLMYGGEPLLVSAIQGPPTLAGLAVAQRLFQIAITPARLLIAPYWGAYADAHARGDRDFLRNTLARQMMFSGFATGLLAAVMATASSWLIPFWTRGVKNADAPLVAACCCLCVLDGLLLPFGIYLNGIGCVRPQAVATVFAFFTYFPVKVTALAWGGVPAMIWTTIAFQIINSFLFYFVVYPNEVWSAVRKR